MPRHLRGCALASLATAVAAALSLAGCAAADRPAATAPASDRNEATGAAVDDLAGELRIFAAASLGAAFDELATRFEQRHPAVDVLPITYDGSSTLATQLVEGATADVFAAADEANMRVVTDAGLAADPKPFASNTLVIAVPRGNPADVTAIDDLSSPDVTVVLCAPEVPCGAASQELLAENGVQVRPSSLEQNVTAVLTKVAAGEADAGLVYATDMRRSDDVDGVPAAGADDVVNHYPIATLTDAADPEVAVAFVDFVLSRGGQAVLHDLGFGAP